METQGITLSGFKYLLLHRPAQLWKLLKEYITAAESQGAEARSCPALRSPVLPACRAPGFAAFQFPGARDKEAAEVCGAATGGGRALNPCRTPDAAVCCFYPRTQGVAVVSFLLRLGFLTQGAAYPLAELPAAEQAVARDMQLFGLLYFVGDGAEQWFFSTPLAATATAELVDRDGGGGGESHGYIIVETNFHLYAYTDSPLVRWRRRRARRCLVNALRDAHVAGRRPRTLGGRALLKLLRCPRPCDVRLSLSHPVDAHCAWTAPALRLRSCRS